MSLHLLKRSKLYTVVLKFSTLVKTAGALVYMTADSQSILKLLFTGIGQQNAIFRMFLAIFTPSPPLFSCHRLSTPPLLHSKGTINQASTPSTFWKFEAGTFPYTTRNF